MIMATEYKLSYTANEINTKIGKIDDLSDEIAVERARIDQFVALEEGSTTGDAELADIRISYDGTIYPTAGEAVRGQFNQFVRAIESNNILNPDDYTLGYIANTGDGTPVSSSTLKYSTPIPVNEGDVFRSYRYDETTGTLTPYAMEFIAAYQNGEIKIYHGGTKSIEYTVPANVDSIVITINLINVHEITKNYEATEYEEYFPKRTEVKQEALPVASETAFGVCKIWTTVNEAGENVLNIVTGE